MINSRKYIYILLIFIFIFSLPVVSIHNNKIVFADQNSAKAMIVIEANSNRVLESLNEDLQLPNASTTKIATFLTVLKHCKNLDEQIEIDPRAVGVSGTSIYLKKGEKLTIKELLYGMMLVSGNDAATALALHVCNSISDFAELMTSDAKDAGAKNTIFKNPHGLDENGHKTTAYDLAQIARECYKYEIFEEIVSCKNTKVSNGENDYRYLKNKNKLLWTLEGANGVKTGYTDDAGRCLVSSCKRGKMHLICVVLNCGPMFEESAAHMENCFSKYNMVKLLPAYSIQNNIIIEDGKKAEIKSYTQKEFCYPLTKQEELKVQVLVDEIECLKAPVKRDTIVGEVKIYFDNCLLFSEKIYTMEDVKSNSVGGSIQRIISKW